MSSYLGRKTDFTPQVYTRYFEHTETPKTSNDHIHFNDNHEETSTNFQKRRDLIIKRLFPSKYADTNNNKTDIEPIKQNGNNSTAQSLGDFISLSNNNSSTIQRKQSSPKADIVLSSSDENETDLLIEDQHLPTHTHESIVGHLHSRSTIESVRAILIRELYERTNDPHTEWLKCKMEIGRDFINPKYYADFQRRYKKDIKKNTMKKNKSVSFKNKIDNGYHVFDITTTDETITTTQMDSSLENIEIIEPSPTKPLKSKPSTSPIASSNDSSNPSKTTPEYIILDTDDDDSTDNLNDNTKSTYFIDRSSTSFTAISQPTSTATEDYHKEDSKYAQLPSRNTTSSPTIIRPILSKHQRRKKPNSSESSKPLVSAIDRIIDQMDQSDTLANPNQAEQQNLVIKKLKKRKKKKKKTSPIN